jgi:hypothetical protein
LARDKRLKRLVLASVTYAVDVLIPGELEGPFEAPALVRALRAGKHARMQLSPGFANVGHG